ncbi:RNA polymerase sigma-70 factor (family 1) [Pedobacter sp. CG_S7]|uniref:RNA polymerase sigma factor n=1 Tax=Pedobacter sp. CG_S7 TaxID=3143930 RepID=UPI003396CCA1
MSNHLPDLKHLINQVALYNNQNAYQQLFKILFPSLFRFSFFLLKSKELAEEVASDVMITLWRNRLKLLLIDNIKVYAFVIARNLSLNELNKNSRYEFISIDAIEIDVFLDSLTPEQIYINDELRKKIEMATQELPNRCKLVFKLIKEEGLSYKETAAILNISTKTVDAQLVIAIKKLTSILKAEFNLI